MSMYGKEMKMIMGKGAQERFDSHGSLGVLQTKRRNDRQQRLWTELAYLGRKTGDKPGLRARASFQYC